MAKARPSRLRPLTLRLLSAPARAQLTITRSPAQGSACKDLGRNGQNRAITPKATYTPVSNRAGSRSLSITRSQGQKPACKDLGRNGQNRAITPKATYTPVSKRPCSRSTKKHSQALWQYFRVVLIHLLALILLRLFLVYIMYYSMKLALTQPEC